MKYLTIFVMLVGCLFANGIQLDCSAKDNGNVVVNVTLPESLDGQVWDTYMYYVVAGEKQYVTMNGCTKERAVLGMLPKQMELSVANCGSAQLEFFVEVCKANSRELLSTAKFAAPIAKISSERNAQPQVKFLQKLDSESVRWYSNYKQFDSKWKYDKMGQYNGTTIGKDGCAMSSAANIIGWTPRDLNNHLKGNGGYQNNLIIWTKVPYLSYSGKKSLSSSLFSSYHVIAYVGGHFVLLTGAKSGGYGSHDPGKSSNPVYSSGQIYSTRCYYK